MAITTKRCKVCGKEYEYCHSVRRNNAFIWQDVACCPEHASIYFAKIEASRANKAETRRTVDNADSVIRKAENRADTENAANPINDNTQTTDEQALAADEIIDTEAENKWAKASEADALTI